MGTKRQLQNSSHLKFWYHFDEPGANDAAVDSSASSINLGILAGAGPTGPFSIAGQVGAARSNADYGAGFIVSEPGTSLAAIVALIETGEWTYQGWVNLATSGTFIYSVWLELATSAHVQSLALSWGISDHLLTLSNFYGGAEHDYVTTLTMPTGAWANVAVTCKKTTVTTPNDSRTFKFWLNGALIYTLSNVPRPDTSGNINPRNLSLIKQSGGSDGHFGAIDETGLFDFEASAAQVLYNYQIGAGLALWVDSVSPSTGASAISVTLTGENFLASPTVTFGGVSATSIVRVSSTVITCVVPAGSGAVDVVVGNADGTRFTLAGGFVYVSPTPIGPDRPIPVRQSGALTWGVDISTFPGLDPMLGPLTGPRVVAEAVARRLRTPRGGLSFYPDFGLDLRGYLLAPLSQAGLSGIRAAVEAEAQKDERVLDASATVQFVSEGARLLVSLTLTTASGPFKLTLLVSKLDVSITTLAA